jgi:predicted NBD/HSP70 family sugar kinase
MSMPRAVRHINEIRVLDALFRTGPMSRADLARELGLTRSTASSLVAGLGREGLVLADQGEAVARGDRTGRPSADVRLNSRFGVFLGADIGVGHHTVVAIDLNADVVGRATKPFDLGSASPDAIVDDLVALIRTVIAKLHNPKALRGLSVTVPGLMDRDGNVLRAPILRWANVPILRMLRTKLPDIETIEAENDANAFAMAELYRAGKSAPTDALYVFLDAGVGGGLVSNGKLLRGNEGYAGEIGHIFVGDEGFIDLTALPGSLESFVGRDALLARHRFHGGSATSVDDFIGVLKLDATSAVTTMTEWSHYLGRGLATLTSVLNPQKIILGGPVAALFEYAENHVLTSIQRHLLPGHPRPEVELSSLGADGPAIGAASLLHRAMLSFDEDLVFNGIRGEPPAEASRRSGLVGDSYSKRN